jgi:hypothetical protein
MIELNWKTVRFIAVGILGALVYVPGSLNQPDIGPAWSTVKNLVMRHSA